MTSPLLKPKTHPFQFKDFYLYWIARFCTILGVNAQSAAVAWQVYEVARQNYSVHESAFYAGLTGLAQFIPMFFLTIPGGILADHYDRKKILMIVLAGQVLLSCGYLLYSYIPDHSLWGFFVLATGLGVLRALSGPANAAISPMLVPKELLPKAIALSSLAFQTGTVVGPALGGFLVFYSPAFAYEICAILMGIAFFAVILITGNTKPDQTHIISNKLLMVQEGLQYIWRTKIVLGAITLDLFAVLLGGVVALLPAFTKDILHGSPDEFGLLRASAGIGAVVTSLFLSVYPIERNAGRWMFLNVGLFGLFTVFFALSTSIWLSIILMALIGAVDMISVYIRTALIQIVTPDHMRARVAAVSYIFVGASNELGEFESGLTARFMGPVNAALMGGFGSILITFIWMKLFPNLLKANKLENPDK